jgi:hypothetical protein
MRLEARLNDRFTCSVCGQEHEGLNTDWAYALPDVVWEIPEQDRKERARFNDDLCQFGERYFVPCVLGVPFVDAPGRFGWGAWAEVNWPTFERYLELYDEDGSSEPPHAGTLANMLSAYPGSLGAPVIIQFLDPKSRPSLYLEKGDRSRLALEQRAGVDDDRYHEMLEIIAAPKWPN